MVDCRNYSGCTTFCKLWCRTALLEGVFENEVYCCSFVLVCSVLRGCLLNSAAMGWLFVLLNLFICGWGRRQYLPCKPKDS